MISPANDEEKNGTYITMQWLNFFFSQSYNNMKGKTNVNVCQHCCLRVVNILVFNIRVVNSFFLSIHFKFISKSMTSRHKHQEYMYMCTWVHVCEYMCTCICVYMCVHVVHVTSPKNTLEALIMAKVHIVIMISLFVLRYYVM